jgi:V/A-type H+-transporting ATPase subunit E
MGYHELVDSLRREGEEKVALIRGTAIAETDRIRGKTAAEMQALRDSYARRRAAAVAVEEGRLVTESRRQAERITLHAENSLVERLYGVALASLAELRDDRYAGHFARLVGELLPCAWEIVRVNPADAALARGHFPGARIVPDSAISGGVRVSGEGGRLTIDNTFEKRLERRWPELAANVMAAVLRLV